MVKNFFVVYMPNGEENIPEGLNFGLFYIYGSYLMTGRYNSVQLARKACLPEVWLREMSPYLCNKTINDTQSISLVYVSNLF